MVCNIVKPYCESGLQRTLVLNRNVNSDNATRKIDCAMEARIIATACGSPPEGYASWTIKLLTEHARVELWQLAEHGRDRAECIDQAMPQPTNRKSCQAAT